MRWFLIDRFTEFVCGQRATAVRGISMSEEAVDQYTPGWPTYPVSLVVEGMAQTGGILVSQLTDFKDRIVLAKVSKLKVHNPIQPGDQLTLHCDLQSHGGIGAMVNGTVQRQDAEPIADLSLMFATLDDERFRNVELFEPAEFCRMLRSLKLFDVGRYPDGSPLQVPQHMLEAERNEYANG